MTSRETISFSIAYPAFSIASLNAAAVNSWPWYAVKSRCRAFRPAQSSLVLRVIQRLDIQASRIARGTGRSSGGKLKSLLM